MKILVILAHPHFEQSRINKRLAAELGNQPGVTVHDLYQVYPDEKIDVQQEQALLSSHDRIILQFPFHWYSAPALLKKWQDSVLGYGWAFGPGGDKLKGKEIMIATSTGGPTHAYVAGGYNHFTMSELLRPFQAVSNLIGTKYLMPFVFHDVRNASDETLETKAQEYAQHAFNAKLSGY